MRLFSIKAFLILAIITVKIVYLDFLISYINKVTLIIQIFMLSRLKSSTVSYIVSYLGLVLSIKLILDLGLDSLNILFIIRY